VPRARVLAYLRVSGQEQGRSGTSLEAQRDEIARWARANEHASPAFFSEIESGSAARTEARAELARLTAEARPGAIVVVCAVDRWSRDIVHAVASVRALVAGSGLFRTKVAGFDTAPVREFSHDFGTRGGP